MGKRRPETEKARALDLVNVFLNSDCSVNKTAKVLGVTHPTVSERMARKPVQDIMKEFLDSEDLRRALISVATDGLQAEKSISAAILVQKDGTLVKADDHGGIMVPDHHARHKYWHDLMTAIKALGSNGNGKNGTHVHFHLTDVERKETLERIKRFYDAGFFGDN